MADTHFTGPVWSANGFYIGDGSSAATGVLGGVGSASSPYDAGSTADQKIFANYVTSSAATGDTRLTYDKLTFTAAGSGETLRAFSVVSGATAAVGGTVNGAHISLEIDGTGGAVSGAGNAIRATIGGTSANPGGTLAALQLDSNFASGVTLPGSAAFIRVTDSNTTKVGALLNLPAPSAGTIFRTQTSAVVSHVIKIVAAGTPYYVMVSSAA